MFIYKNALNYINKALKDKCNMTREDKENYIKFHLKIEKELSDHLKTFSNFRKSMSPLDRAYETLQILILDIMKGRGSFPDPNNIEDQIKNLLFDLVFRMSRTIYILNPYLGKVYINDELVYVAYQTLCNNDWYKSFSGEEQRIPEERFEYLTKLCHKIQRQILSEKTNEDDIIIVKSPLNNKLIEYFSIHPETLYHLTDLEFEIIMAEVYQKLGYNVIRTPQTRDGGKDIILTDHSPTGDFIYYVECKKYAPQRPVGIGIVQRLNGVIVNDNVNGGVIATTSYFSKPAKDFINNSNQNRIKMHDIHNLQVLFEKCLKIEPGI